MHFKDRNHAKSLLRKYQGEMSERIRDGWDRDEVEARYGPKIEQAKAYLENGGVDETNTRRATSTRNRHHQKSHRKSNKPHFDDE